MSPAQRTDRFDRFRLVVIRPTRHARAGLTAFFTITIASLLAVAGLTAIASAQDGTAPSDASHSIYSCPDGATLDGTFCVTNATSVWVPGDYSVGSSAPVGSCPQGWELDGIFCYQPAVVAEPTCPEGGAPDPATVTEDGTISRCIADLAPDQLQCPSGYIGVDDTCFAEPIDAANCPAGGAPDPDEIAPDGTVLGCTAQASGRVTKCPVNYLNVEGVCSAAPTDPDQTQTCPEGELRDGQCRMNALFRSGPGAMCNGEPTTEPAESCGSWELRGGERVPATVNTRPTPVPVPMRILGDEPNAGPGIVATPTPAVTLEAADGSLSVEAPHIDLSGTGAAVDTTAQAETGSAAPQATPGFTLSRATSTPSMPNSTATATATASTTSGDSPKYRWGATRPQNPEARPKLAFTGSAAKPLVMTALGLMTVGFLAVEANRQLRKHDARKHLPRRFR